jgi:gluconolactonase
MSFAISKPEVLVSGIQTPEGPAFDGDGNLYWVNWELHSIMRRTPAGEVSEIFNTGGIPAGLAFGEDGWLYIADEGDDIHGIMRITPDGSKHEIVVNHFRNQPLNGANDLVFDANGVLYFSDPWRSSLDNPIGGFYRLMPDGELDVVDSGLCFPNGVAVSGDNSYVYLAETQRNRILRYLINGDGTHGPREHWADTTLPSGPDGMCFAASGELLVAHYSGSGVDVFGTDGKQVGFIEIPGRFTTNCCFGGPNNSTLIVTDVDTKSLYSVETSLKGQPLNDGRVYA